MFFVKYAWATSFNERVRFLKLLFRWKCSIWQLLWVDFLVYMSLYTGLTLLYRLHLVPNDPYGKQKFEGLVKYANKIGSLMPLSFLLGFFVSTILGRWWELVNTIPWMSSPAFLTQALVNGDKEDEKLTRKVRLSVMRYMNLSWILSMYNLSRQIKRRFRSEKVNKSHVTTVRERLEKINADPGVKKFFGSLIIPEEIVVFERLEKANVEEMNYKPEYWVPLQWATRVLNRACQQGLIRKDRHYVQLCDMVNSFRGSLGTLSVFNEFNIPLVYIQVVVIAVYSFFISELFTQQFIDVKASSKAKDFEFDAYVPVMSIMKFLLYMGWFKIGLSLINPLSDERNEFPMSDILDFNLRISTHCAPAWADAFPDFLTDEYGSTFDQLRRLCEFSRDTPPTTLTNPMASVYRSAAGDTQPLVFDIDESNVDTRSRMSGEKKELFESAPV